MSQELIDHSADLKKLIEEGYQIEIKKGHLLIHQIPYVTARTLPDGVKISIKYGVLVTTLSLSGDQTIKPDTHVMHFIGEYPCRKDGTAIESIRHNSNTQVLADGITVYHSFSNKPPNGYADYYEKVTTYATILSAPAKSIDPAVNEKPLQLIEASADDSVFQYIDTNSVRAEILPISSKLEGQKIAIIGLGGTGSYVLDFLAKTPVREIHLFDGDKFVQKNAFRSPGAPSKDILKELINKAIYFSDLYTNMRRNIVPHDYNLTKENVGELSDMDFVFICVDKGEIKEPIITKLSELGKSFVDVGLGVLAVDGFLLGMIRTTTSTKEKRDHIKKHISFTDAGLDDYSSNIQIAELNALNASFAVIKWKKLTGFFQDLTREHNSIYVINTGQLIHENET